MFKRFCSLLPGALRSRLPEKNTPSPHAARNPTAAQAPAPAQVAPADLHIAGLPPFPLARHLDTQHGFPVLDWAAAHAWLDGAPGDALKREAWNNCARGWLLHFRDRLLTQATPPAHSAGGGYALHETGSALLLCALPANQARAALDFVTHTQARVGRVLKGLASTRNLGKHILIIFEQTEKYYDYISRYYPEQGGEFAATGGVFIGKGCGHYVLHGNNLGTLERVIAHEMTHGQLAHLKLPRWLDEGIAVNTERRLAGATAGRHSPREMHALHRAHWDAGEIQKFWSGDAFFDPRNENQHLSYDLARIIVEQLAGDWPRFTRFALHATHADAGAQAARDHLGMDLGDVARALLERPDSIPWTPAPESWGNPLAAA